MPHSVEWGIFFLQRFIKREYGTMFLFSTVHGA
jgi:hypothetical protein